MARLRFADVQSRPTEFLDFTSLTLDEFHQRVPSFEAAFQAHMAAWRLDGKPRTARQCAVYKHCPLPTPEDRLFFLLTYLKTYECIPMYGTRCLRGKEAPMMAGGRCTGLQSRPRSWISPADRGRVAAPRAVL